MKKQFRLLKSEDFKNVIDARRRIRTDSFKVFVKENGRHYLRVGLSVSKKIGKAHVRVKVRRQLRACFDLLSIFDCNYDIVVIANPGFLDRDFAANMCLLKDAVSKLTARG